jgi:hypothetical protein
LHPSVVFIKQIPSKNLKVHLEISTLELYKNVLILKGISPKILFKLFGRVFNVTSLLMRILRLAKVRFHQQLLILYGSPECQLMAGFVFLLF